MLLAGLLTAALDDPALARVRDLARDKDEDQVDIVGPASLRSVVAAVLAADPDRGGTGRPVLAVTATTREAEDLAASLSDLIPAEFVVVYPAWETLPHERLSPRSDTVGRRLDILRRLAHPDAARARPLRVVVAPVRSVLQPQLKGLGDLVPVELRPGDRSGPELGRTPPGRHRLRTYRPGHQAGRVRGPRRDPGRVPAHRGAPAAGGVLG